MPLPTAAELTDPNATNSQMKQRLGQLAENVESKDDATTKANTAKNYTDIKVYDVDADKLSRSDIFTESSNLFDYTAVTRGYSILSTGEVAASATSAFSDFIAVDPSESYYFDGFRHVAFYDINKNFISRVGQVISGTGIAVDPYKYYGAIQTPQNCYYIRANYNQVLPTYLTDPLDGRKINKGSVSLPYEPFSLSLNKTVSVSGVNLESKSVSVSAIEFIEESKNLFNPATVTSGKIISDTGAISDNASYAISDFISVKGGQKYTISSSSGVTAFTNTSYYDVNKQFIRRDQTGFATLYTLRLPEDAAYIRFNLNVAANGAPSTGNRMFNLGDQALPYEAWYKPKLEGVDVISGENYADLSSDLLLRNLAQASNNLFNEVTVTKGNKLIDASGSIISPPTADIDWAYTDYVKVDAQKSYYVDGFRSVAFYDSGLNFISRISVPTTGSGIAVDPYKYHGVITLPTNAKFIRANYRLFEDTDYSDGRKINEGSSSLPYEPFYLNIKPSVRIGKGIIQNSTVTADNLDFIEKSSNLFNYATCTDGVSIRDTGLIDPIANYAISDFITVKSGTKYTISSSDAGINVFIHIAYYNAAKEFIRRETTTTGTVTITTRNDVAFVRFNINKSIGLPSQKNRMFNEGATALPYEPWQPPKLLGVTVASEVDRGEVEQIIDDKIAELSTNDAYIARSYNLFNVEACTIGKAIDGTGAFLDRSDYAVSDFISVNAGEKYTTTSDVGYVAWINVIYFDTGKNFVGRIQTDNAPTGFMTIEIPVGVSYVRFNINLNTGQPSQRNRMFVEGDNVLPYKPYRIESLLPLAPEALKEVGSEVRLNRADNYIFDYDLNELFTTSATLGSHLNFNSSTSAQVYQMYDDLMAAHPNHITKQALGDDAWGNPIALYRFKAPQPVTTQRTKMAKVFLTTGVHGMEHVAVLTAYLMFEQMMSNWESSKLLEVLRNNVEFLIIPVCNPTGYDKYTRKNDNGVDINRNFPDGFGWQSTDPTSAYYGGAAPLDQLESQYIVRVFDENPDIDVMYDFHNFNGTSAASHPHLVWIPAYTGGLYVEHMTQSLVRKLTNHWRDKFTWIPQSETWFAGYSSTTEGAMVKDYAVHSRGIPFTATFEVGGKWWIDPTGVPYDLNHKQSCLEALVNFMLINLNELKRI